MTKLRDLLSEALPLSVARKYIYNWDKQKFKDWFGSKYRIYIPLKQRLSFKHGSYQIKVSQELKDNGYIVVDYIKGIAKDKTYGRIEKIGRILTKLKSSNLSLFINDPIRRTSKKQPIVCISRHPYDIAGMSTDRGWTSCKSLHSVGINYDKFNHDGEHSRFVLQESKYCLIAYLIYEDDRNINHPIARILILPFVNKDNPEDIRYDTSNICYGTVGIYGDSFIDTVNEWLDQKQLDVNQKDQHNYQLSDKVYYDDTDGIGKYSYEYRKNNWKDGEYTQTNWYGGQFHDGIFQGVTWYNGTWYNGTWKGATWKNGIWHTGHWSTGTWQNGVWMDGLWTSGRWKDGIWYKGTWVSGKWKGGWIYDPNHKGRYTNESSWSKDGKFVFTNLSPDEYWK